jgi:hypothetical protein
MRWSRLLPLALLALVPACGIFGPSGPSLPAVMPPNFFLGLRVLEATDPPVDYVIKIERSGKVQYETTIRTPRRRRFDGELELVEAQIIRLYDAVLASDFADHDPEYSAEEGATDRRENGERIFYVTAGDLDKRIDVNYATLPELDALQEAIIAEMPSFVLTGDGGPGSILGRPDAYLGDKSTHVFHHPECELAKKIDEADRDPYANEFDALNFGYHPCEICRPLETRK